MSAGAELVAAAGASLEQDPVQYMAVVLNRAKGWLAEAASIEDVREQRAIAVGYESVIREKELAFDAQLAATEIVRRCERRIGELVREGQREGTVLSRGQTLRRPGHDPVALRDGERPIPVHRAMGVNATADQAISDSYTFADAPSEQFEQAITDARSEGNLSRANVVRKVKGEQPKPAERSEWHRKKRHIDSNRILRSLAQELDAATAGLDLIERDALDPELRDECLRVIRRSLRTINTHLRRIS